MSVVLITGTSSGLQPDDVHLLGGGRDEPAGQGLSFETKATSSGLAWVETQTWRFGCDSFAVKSRFAWWA